MKPEEWGKLTPYYRPAYKEDKEAFDAELGKNDTRKIMKIEVVYRWHKDKPSEWYWREI